MKLPELGYKKTYIYIASPFRRAVTKKLDPMTLPAPLLAVSFLALIIASEKVRMMSQRCYADKLYI